MPESNSPAHRAGIIDQIRVRPERSGPSIPHLAFISDQEGRNFRNDLRRRAFSLIEVVLALGIISFAMVAVLGLLPAGLGSQKQAIEQSFGTQALNGIAQTVKGIYIATNGAISFPAPLNTVAVGLGSASFPLYEDGSLTNTASARKGTVFIDQKAINGSLHPVFISVAWPQNAARSGAAWTNSQGSASAFLYVMP